MSQGAYYYKFSEWISPRQNTIFYYVGMIVMSMSLFIMPLDEDD